MNTVHTPRMPSLTSCSCPVRTALILTIGLATASATSTAARQGPPVGTRPAVVSGSSRDAQLLVGTWDLVDFSRRATDGGVTAPWGSQPAGRITYDADGHVTALVMHERRNEASGRVSPPEVQADFSAYFGTYSIDTAQRIVTHHVQGSLNASGASGDLRRNYEFEDSALILTFKRRQDGALVTLKFKRVSRSNP